MTAPVEPARRVDGPPSGRHSRASTPRGTIDVVVHPDAAALAATTAARLLVRLVDLQAHRSPLHLVLTGGTVGIDVLRAAAASPVREAVDWSGVHVWWGDERFVPAGSHHRNERHAREALLDALPLPAGNVHPVASSDTAPDEGAAAAAYAAELARYAPSDDDADATASGGVAPAGGSVPDTVAVPAFDVLLLGVGPDGHVASLFPGHGTLAVTDATVVGERDSPKPPPGRVSLTFPAIRAAREVWLVAAGESKADAVAAALTGTSVEETPAAGAHGTERTLWLLDVAAASKIPTP